VHISTGPEVYANPWRHGCPERMRNGCPEPVWTGCPEPMRTGCPEPMRTGCPEQMKTGCPESMRTGCPEPMKRVPLLARCCHNEEVQDDYNPRSDDIQENTTNVSSLATKSSSFEDDLYRPMSSDNNVTDMAPRAARGTEGAPRDAEGIPRDDEGLPLDDGSPALQSYSSSREPYKLKVRDSLIFLNTFNIYFILFKINCQIQFRTAKYVKSITHDKRLA